MRNITGSKCTGENESFSQFILPQAEQGDDGDEGRGPLASTIVNREDLDPLLVGVHALEG